MSQSVIHNVVFGEVAIYTSRCPGKQSVNEDAVAIVPFDNNSCVLIVADGMGGHSAGEVASRTAIREMVLAVNEAHEKELMLRVGIINGFEQANQAVQDLGTGAGTTLAAVEVTGSVARPYHAGDSVVVVVGSRGKVKLETTSHSPVGYGVAAGLLDSEEAMQHEERHIILNAVGSPSMRIEIGSAIKLAQKDTILLASDGLTDNVKLNEAIEMIRKGKLKASTDRLIELARNRMSVSDNGHPSKPDDLTVALFRSIQA